MQIEEGALVKSTHGKDANQLFFVTEIINNKAKLVNGSNRPLKKPKIKNLKHIILIKNCNLDFKFLNDCDIIYKLKCFSRGFEK